jgi:hypothetical protein
MSESAVLGCVCVWGGDEILFHSNMGVVFAGWVWRTLVGTDVWIAGQSAWRHQNLPCGWRSWAGPCVFMGLTGFFWLRSR